jgi:NADP-dependent alcohol dehydrogenase
MNEAIAKTVEFFIPWEWILNLIDYTKTYDKTADFIVNRFDERGWKGLGENITLEKVKSIVENKVTRLNGEKPIPKRSRIKF